MRRTSCLGAVAARRQSKESGMTGLFIRMSTVAAVALCAASAAAAADFPITAVPPAQYRPAATKATTPTMLLDAAAPARRIALDAPSDAEIAALRALNAGGKGGATPARTVAKGAA